MNIYEKTLSSLESGTFSIHIKILNEIANETSDKELINEIEGLKASLGSFEEFKKQIDPCSNFCIQKDQSTNAKKLIEYCEKK